MPFSFTGSFIVPEINWLEKIVRPFLVYVFLVIAFRLTGKRLLGSRTPFDFIVLLTIANVLQNAMIGPDNSVLGGILGATTLLATDILFDKLAYQFRWFKHLIEGDPTVLVEDGKINFENLKREYLTTDDLRRAVAKENIDLDSDLPTLRRVLLESDGTITVARMSGPLNYLLTPDPEST
jgi:uncharacterized membrane protein YcaP (DUF421 family)